MAGVGLAFKSRENLALQVVIMWMVWWVSVTSDSVRRARLNEHAEGGMRIGVSSEG